jgi:hypothetical protein
MHDGFKQFENWIESEARRESHFSATFWFLFSTLPEREFRSSLGLREPSRQAPPIIQDLVALGHAPFEASTTVTITKRTGTILQASFSLLPVHRENVYLLFSLDKPTSSLRPMYRLRARARGKVQLFPFGHPVIKSCAQLSPGSSLDETYVIRGVSYPSRPSDGGAEINLRPGNASSFFSRVDEEKRILKTVRLRVPTSSESFCEFSIGRSGYVTYHKGRFGPLWERMTGRLSDELSTLVRPFQRAAGRFVEFRFAEPLFVGRSNYNIVLEALSRLPRASVALLHRNPYFHATLTNYEDGGEFDVFITGHSTIHVQGQGDVSPASFLRIQNGLTELFRDASVSLEEQKRYTLRQLMEGQV